MLIRRLSLLSAASLLVSVGIATPAHALARLACGRTVTSSVTLSADIGPCPGDGLIVAGSGITVNLGGHTVRGNGDPTNDQVGVRLENVSGVVVTNGTVAAFAAGVALENTTRSTVKAIRAKNNRSTGEINHGDGIVADGSSNNQILGNDVSGNGPFSGISMLDGANNNLVRGNNIHDNTLVRAGPEQVGPRQEDYGVRFDTDASFNTVDSNTILANGSAGVNAPGFQHTDNVITNNLIQGNGQQGIIEPGINYLLAGNVVGGNGFDQFEVPGRTKRMFDGILLFGNLGGGPGTIRNNVVTGNAHDGIALVTLGFTFFGTYHPPVVDHIQDNVVLNNGHDGIFLQCEFVADAFPRHVCLSSSPPHEGEHVLRNTALGNGGANAGTSAWDLHDESPNCDGNQWLDNTGRTVNPPCTLTRSPG